MDSGTSGGSMQSGSSGGEDDQNDTGSFSAVSRLHRSNPNLHHQPYFSPQQQQQQQLLQFPPLTNNLFFDTLPQSDLDRIWASGVTRHPPPPQPLHQEQEHHHHYQQQQKLCSASSLSSSFLASSSAPRDPQPKPPGRASSGSKETGSGSSGRVVKKRTRASRKTPTTVLTTDAANFRAMVQEFTGIPTPPFAPSPFFPAKNFDLFGGGGPNSPSLGSLLYSLSNPHSFAPPSITADAYNNVASSSFQDEQSHQQMAMMMRRRNNTMSSSPNTLGQNQNPNPGAFQPSSAAIRPPFSSSEYPSRGGENDQ
uniref:VQ domain-containing protein n=1 Tax=Kalanchoe fedtschenkoi TaxID=63787 RepID=A0A7N0ULX4_KALFE